MLLETPRTQLRPFELEDFEQIKKWFYDPRYFKFFRHHMKVYRDSEFQTYPQIVGSEVFMVIEKETNTIQGMVQLGGDPKNNRAFYLGILLDAAIQKSGLCMEVLAVTMDHCYNRMGFKKCIIEVLESDKVLVEFIKRVGFTQEGTLINECYIDGTFQNEVRFMMLDEYFKVHGKPTLNEWRL